VPAPASLQKSSRAPMRSARSRAPRNPQCPADPPSFSTVESIPMPLSRIRTRSARSSYRISVSIRVACACRYAFRRICRIRGRSSNRCAIHYNMTSTLVSAVVALRMLGRSIDTLGTNLNCPWLRGGRPVGGWLGAFLDVLWQVQGQNLGVQGDRKTLQSRAAARRVIAHGAHRQVGRRGGTGGDPLGLCAARDAGGGARRGGSGFPNRERKVRPLAGPAHRLGRRARG